MPIPPICAALLLSLAVLQQDSADQKMTTFHDDLAKVTILYPALLKDKNASEKQAAVVKGNERVKADHPDTPVAITSDNIPLLATTPAGTSFQMVQFSRFDGKTINTPTLDAGLRDMASGMVVAFTKMLIDPHVGTIQPLDLGNHHGIASFNSGQLQTNKSKTMYLAIVCFTNSGQDACLCEVAFDKVDLIDLLHNPMQFDGESSRPLVDKPVVFE